MKNKFLKGAHLSERKFKEILKLFSEDLTATQIAEVSEVSRVTINSYLKRIRTQIVNYCDSMQPIPAPTGASWVAPASNAILSSTAEVGVTTETDRIVKPVIFGIYRQNGKLYTHILPDVNRTMIQAISRGRSVLESAEVTERIRKYAGVVDLGQYRLYNLASQLSTESSIQLAEEVSNFWTLTRNRLAKFKGLNRNTIYLHLKECEFRYNHRNEDLYVQLVNLLKANPLHYN
jgi:transposase